MTYSDLGNELDILLTGELVTNWINLITRRTAEQEALFMQGTVRTESSKKGTCKGKKVPTGKSREHFHFEAGWNLLTKVSTLSRAGFWQSGTGDETDKHTQETSTALSGNWLWLNTSCHQGSRSNERKGLFLFKKRISVRKRVGNKREKCLQRDHYAFCKEHIVKGKGKSSLILKLYSV